MFAHAACSRHTLFSSSRNKVNTRTNTHTGKNGLKSSSLAVALACEFALAQPFEVAPAFLDTYTSQRTQPLSTDTHSSSAQQHAGTVHEEPQALQGMGGLMGHTNSGSMSGWAGSGTQHHCSRGSKRLAPPLQPRLLFVTRLLKRLHSELAAWLASCAHELQGLAGHGNSNGGGGTAQAALGHERPESGAAAGAKFLSEKMRRAAGPPSSVGAAMVGKGASVGASAGQGPAVSAAAAAAGAVPDGGLGGSEQVAVTGAGTRSIFGAVTGAGAGAPLQKPATAAGHSRQVA
eukprot:scaffold264675_cov20-Tisochrysis_lutea.AAC.1